MTRTLTVTIEAIHPVTSRAAWELGRAWSLAGGRVRIGVGASPRVRIGLGSLIRPSAVIAFERPFVGEEAAKAGRLALTVAAWDALDEHEAWRDLAAPLPSPRLGTPSDDRPWAVALAARPTQPGHQLHLLGGVPAPKGDAVWWPRTARIAAAVLGRAECVLGEGDPLVFDAIRAGIPVRTATGQKTSFNVLAGLVPPALTTDPALWQHVATMAREVHADRGPTPLMTPHWVGRARERMRARQAAPADGWERLRRRHDKLRRDPKRFFADSRHAALRLFGQVLFSGPGEPNDS